MNIRIEPQRVVVINRPDRPEKKQLLLRHLDEIGWPFVAPEWHSATPGDAYTPPKYWKSPANVYACNQSHKQILQESMDRGDENVWIMEDDCRYLPGFKDRVDYVLKHAPEDWGMIYFGGVLADYSKSPWQGKNVPLTNYFNGKIPPPKNIKISGDLYQVSGLNNTESYLVNRRYFQELIDSLCDTELHVDVAFNLLQHTIPTYAAVPSMACQQGLWSDNFGLQRDEKKHARLVTSSKSGAIILSAGENRRLMLSNAAASFRRNNLRRGLKIVTDQRLAGYDCEVIKGGTGFTSRKYKTQLLKDPGFENGVILDDDTITMCELPDIEQLLGDNDLALASDQSYPYIRNVCYSEDPKVTRWLQGAEAKYMRDNYALSPRDVHYNTGVIFFRNTARVREFAEAWYEQWKKFAQIDQMAFYRALQQTGLQVTNLSRVMHWIAPHTANSIPKGIQIAHLTHCKDRYSDILKGTGLPVVPPPVVM